MTALDVYAWIQGSWLGQMSAKSGWLFVTMQTAHFMGLSLLLGTMAVIDLRILRVIRRLPIPNLLDLIPLALIGFAIQLVSGITMFTADPSRYWENMAFRAKILLVLVAGANALWFWRFEHAALRSLGPGQEPRRPARVIAALSLAIWVIVLALGRFMTYLEGVDYGALLGGTVAASAGTSVMLPGGP